ncbi:hypothetical protein [Stenotrophomonas maltophilia]|uniref:hypothetical protein n=1 Tax=Stenotrophomonas maltophilia TaxID=40324 RepID=UPI0022F3AD90|nr:hypothetical protein [Stenotrophomonas maltophilia]
MTGIIESYPVCSSFILGGMWMNGFAAHRMLLKMERERPEVLGAVGIIRVDWWFRCLRGIGFLALSGKGLMITRGERWVLRGVVATYMFLVACGISMLVG